MSIAVISLETMNGRVERLETMRVAHVHVLSDTPEDDAGKKIMEWAECNGIYITSMSGEHLRRLITLHIPYAYGVII